MADGLQLPIKPENSGRCTSGFCTPKQDKKAQTMLVTPKRVLPIIFIPRIMGSNLRMSAERQAALARENNRSWHPDAKYQTFKFSKLAPAQRQLHLDPRSNSLDSYESIQEKNDKSNRTTRVENNSIERLPYLYRKGAQIENNILLVDDPIGTENPKSKEEKALERGWGEIFFDSYGTLLQLLEQHLNDPFGGGSMPSFWWKNQIIGVDPKSWGTSPDLPQTALTEIGFTQAISNCWFPVHAMGYNWLLSNKSSGQDIADRIRSLIDMYISKGYRCEKVILVTHSMGGLVARAAMHPSIGNLQNSVLGVIHGAMPAIGAGTTYKRMKCGFEGNDSSITRRVLGETGREVTAVLGNSQGGMELLPSKSYGNGWLTAQFNGQISLSLPSKSDPFEEIYKIQGRWYQLLNPLWVNPAGRFDKGISQSLDLLDSAKKFHEIINKYYHPITFAIYGADNNRATWGNVIWELNNQIQNKKISELKISSDNAKGKINFKENSIINNEVRNKTKSQPTVASLAGPRDAGDETVPIRSSDDQLGYCKAIFRQVGYEHQDSYKDKNAISATFYSIVKILENMKWQKK